MLEESKFENVLQSLRVRKGKVWTQVKTAYELGVSVRTYKGWENGERVPDHRDLKNIAALFSLDTEAEAELYRAASQAPPKIHNLPFPQNPFFTGREAQLVRLNQLLRDNGSVAISQSVSISGLGGIGKTQLALEYAHRSYPSIYRAVFWVNAADEATLQESYNDLARLLELQERNERESDQHVLVKQWLERHTDWLLIMDNADDLELARSFFPKANQKHKSRQGHILLTTRSHIVGNIVANQIEIDKMEPDEGLSFLLRRTNKLGADTNVREAVAMLVELLDGHPLALDQAGAYIEETGVSFTEYVARYQKERRYLLNRRKSQVSKYSDHPEPLAMTFELCFQRAREWHPLATDILSFCAFLQPDAIPEEFFQHADGFRLSTVEFDDAIAVLYRFSLIKRNTQEKTFSLHRLVQDVLTDGMLPDLQKQFRWRVVQALNAAFPKNSFVLWRQRWQTERFLPHIMLCAMWTDDELTPTLEIANFFDRVTAFCLKQHLLSAAEWLLVRVISIYEQYLGVEHPMTVSALSSLAFNYQGQGKYEQAEALFQHVINILEQRLGAEHPLTQITKEDYAEFLHRRDRHAEAAALEANDEPTE